MKQFYGLLGFPLTHSFSRTFFNEKFESEGVNAEYLNFEIPDISTIKEIIVNYPELCGLNVTIPYKEAVIPFLDDMDETARKIGAVNVIKFIRSKGKLKLKGYNSDVIGFSESIRPMLGQNHTHALILGSGGASKAVHYGLDALGIESVYVSRTPGKGQFTYEDLTAAVMDKYKVIINTTPLGMYPRIDSAPALPYDLITPQHLAYDLLYNPDETLFMKKAKQRGAEVKNGLEMLLLQAFAAWDIWQSR